MYQLFSRRVKAIGLNFVMTQLKDLQPEFPDPSGMWLDKKIPNPYFDLSVISCVKDLSDYAS